MTAGASAEVAQAVAPPRLTGPRRRLAAATFVATVGTGIYYALVPIYLLRGVGLSAAQIGLAMSVGGAVGLPAGFALGHAADRLGPRWVVALAYAVQGLAAGSLALASNLPEVTAALCFVFFSNEGGRAVRYLTIARIGGDDYVHFRAQMQVVTNIGLAIGAALAGVAAQLNTRHGYDVALLAIAACFVGSAVVLTGLPHLPPLDPPGRDGSDGSGGHGGGGDSGERLTAVLRDAPYLSLTALNALLIAQTQVLLLGIPLWIVSRHVAPAWTVAATLLVNTLLVAALQVRAVRRLDTPRAAGRAWRRAGIAFLLGCVIVPLTDPLPAWAATLVVLAAVVVHSIGEIWYAGGMFQIALGLAPAHAMGKYQGVFNLGEGVTAMIAPAVVTALCIGWGGAGWLVMGLVLLAPGLAAPSAAAWAERTRPASLP